MSQSSVELATLPLASVSIDGDIQVTVSQWCQFILVSLMSQPQKCEIDSGNDREMGHDCKLFLSSLSLDPQISDRPSLLTHIHLLV